MSKLEKFLHRVIPNMLDLFVTPLTTILITGYFSLTIFGPIFGFFETRLITGVQFLLSIPFGIGSAICGVFYAPIVVVDVQHMYHALKASLLGATGENAYMPIASAANVAQGAAALAYGIRSKDKKLRSIAFPASMSAFLGITEPAIFGVNLRFWRPFLAGILGGAAGGLVSGISHITSNAYGVTGIFGILITTDHSLSYLLMMAVSFLTAFLLTLLFCRNCPKDLFENDAKTPDLIVAAPLSGTLIPLENVSDEIFAKGTLGKGIAILPTSSHVLAPADGVVTTLSPTAHAIGLTLNSGIEILIHIGVDTEQLHEMGFAPLVQEGETVSLGQSLLLFDPT